MVKLITESRAKPSGVLYAVINTSTLDSLPVLGTDNGDGTSTLKVDTELTATIDPTGLATHEGQEEILAKQPTLEGTDKAKVSLYVKKSANADTVLTLGNTDDANSLPVTLSTESLAALETVTVTLPSGNLGQQPVASSLSVAPADNITDATYIGDIKFGESAPLDISYSTGDTDSKTVRVKLSNDDLTALETISLTGSLPDTSASDLAHIHTNSDTIAGAISATHMQTDIVGELPAGTQLIGKTSIDQTTDGTSNRVVAKISQTAGENHVEICDSSGNGITSTTNALDINIKSGNPTTIGISGNIPDTAASDLSHIHANLDTLAGAVSSTHLQCDVLDPIPDTSGDDFSGIHTAVDNIDGKIAASSINEYNVTLTLADTEYHQDLPSSTKGIEFISRNGYPVRYAFTTGKVATPTEPYFTLRSNCSYESPVTLNLSSKIIYFGTDNAGDVIELIAWS